MEIRVSATRQELTRLKKRVQMAVRGHKLLKDKRDQLMKEFLAIVHENQRLREEIENQLTVAYKAFFSQGGSFATSVGRSLNVFSRASEISVSYRNIMNVVVPEMSLDTGKGTYLEERVPPYGFAATSSDLDDAIGHFMGILPLLVKLSEIERKIQLLADEIEKTRRRVNALEYVLIPELEQAIKGVEMRLEEADRATASRLMKIKDIVRAH